MQVTMLLADFVQVSDGKLTAVGAGWTITPGGDEAIPFGIGLIFDIPWDRANEIHHFVLRLVDEDGNPVMQPSDGGDLPFQLDGTVEVGRPPGVPRGTPLQSVLGVNVGAIPLPPGRGYEWRLDMGDTSQALETRPFRTRPTA